MDTIPSGSSVAWLALVWLARCEDSSDQEAVEAYEAMCAAALAGGFESELDRLDTATEDVTAEERTKAVHRFCRDLHDISDKPLRTGD